MYIGGLPYELSEGDIVTIFSQYGEPTYVNLIRDKDTGKSKGFAFLKYEDQRSTTLAVDNLGGANILGRTIRVDHTRYKIKEGDGAEGTVLDAADDGERGSKRRRQSESVERSPTPESLPEEVELQKLIRDHDEDDPMKDWLVREKKKEVEEARKKRDMAVTKKRSRDDKGKSKSKHRSHRHRTRSREGRRHRSGSRERKSGRHRSKSRDRRERSHRTGKEREAQDTDRDVGGARSERMEKGDGVREGRSERVRDLEGREGRDTELERREKRPQGRELEGGREADGDRRRREGAGERSERRQRDDDAERSERRRFDDDDKERPERRRRDEEDERPERRRRGDDDDMADRSRRDAGRERRRE